MFKLLAILAIMDLTLAAAPVTRSDMAVGQEAPAREQDETLIVSISVDLLKDQRIGVGGEIVSEEALVGRMFEVTKNRNCIVYLRADRGLSYDWVMGIMARIQAGGFPRVVLIAAKP